MLVSTVARVDGGRRRIGARGGEPGRTGVVVGEPLDVVLERVQTGGREDADLAHPGAVALAPDARLGHRVGGADEHRPDRRAQALGQADADGVELAAVVGQRHPGGHVRVPEPGAVEVHGDADGLRGPPDLADGLDRLHRAAAEVVGVLEHDERGLDLVGPDPGGDERHRAGRVEQAALAGPRAARDAGERRGGTELGAQHVCLLVGDELLARAHVQPHAELVGQRPGRREQPRLVAEQPGDALLERAHGGVLAEDVVADLGVRHRLAHRAGRGGQGVGEEVGAHRVSPG